MALFVEPAIPTVQDLTCSNVEISFCKNVLPSVNETYKTPLSKAQQEEMYLEYYNPLVNINCSSFSRLFVCTAHFPFCSSHRELQPLLPCRSVCLDVYSRCFKHFNRYQLAWPKHLNCSFFPQQPAICIKPSTASSFTTSTPATSPSSTTLPSAKTPSATTPPLSSRSFRTTQITPQASTFYFTTTQATDTDFSSFILFIADFVPRLIYYLTFAFAFISFAVLLPFFVFVFYFIWLRIRGQPNQEERRQELPLRERLGSLPPVPEP